MEACKGNSLTIQPVRHLKIDLGFRVQGLGLNPKPFSPALEAPTKLISRRVRDAMPKSMESVGQIHEGNGDGANKKRKAFGGGRRDALTQVHGMYVPNFASPPPVFRKGIGQQLEPCFIDRRGPDSPGHSMPFLEYS